MILTQIQNETICHWSAEHSSCQVLQVKPQDCQESDKTLCRNGMYYIWLAMLCSAFRQHLPNPSGLVPLPVLLMLCTGPSSRNHSVRKETPVLPWPVKLYMVCQPLSTYCNTCLLAIPPLAWAPPLSLL